MAENEVPPDPVEAPEADVFEQRRRLVGDEPDTGSTRRDPEEPDEPGPELPPRLPVDADPADAYEQTRAVDYDEDDYR